MPYLEDLFPFASAPHCVYLISIVEIVRKMASSTSMLMRLPRLAYVTHQATGHLRKQQVSQKNAFCDFLQMHKMIEFSFLYLHIKNKLDFRDSKWFRIVDFYFCC